MGQGYDAGFMTDLILTLLALALSFPVLFWGGVVSCGLWRWVKMQHGS